MEAIISWLDTHMLPCMIKSLTGLDCPGCGMQRSFVLLLKGEFAESFFMFPPLLPLIFMVALLAAHLIFRFKKGASILLITFILNTAFLLTSYIIKMVNHGPWTVH